MQASPVTQTRGLKLLIERKREPDQSALDHSKFLIITPRKAGKAHVRNQLRRRLKAIIYENELTKLPVRFAILCYPQAADRSYAELKQFLIETLEKIRV